MGKYTGGNWIGCNGLTLNEQQGEASCIYINQMTILMLQFLFLAATIRIGQYRVRDFSYFYKHSSNWLYSGNLVYSKNESNICFNGEQRGNFPTMFLVCECSIKVPKNQIFPYKSGRKEGGRSKRVKSLFYKHFIYGFVEKYVKKMWYNKKFCIV